MSTTAKAKDDSFVTDPDIPNDEENKSSHSSIHEDAPEEPKFVPKDTLTGTGARDGGPMIMMRKMTLTKAQIDTTLSSGAAVNQEHSSLLDCILCKNVMLDPRECHKCRKGFCKKCVNDYIDQLIQGEYQVCCPNCSSTTWRLVDPHPILTRQLDAIKARCENADIGCTDILAYGDLAKHQTECGYAKVKCTNFGCDLEMFQKDFTAHEDSCEHRIIRCDKCEVIKIPDQEHDCMKSMAQKYEHMEGKLIGLTQRLSLEMERAERNRLAGDKGTQLVRYEIGLPALSQIKFEVQNGWQQTLSEDVVGLPANTRVVIVKFGLTDVNVRRDYASLVVHQAGSPSKVDLTNHFFVGPQPLPAFGQCTEIIMPWDSNLEAKLVVEFQVAPPQYPPHPAMNPYGPNPYGGYMPQPPHHQQKNPYGFAMFSIAGFQFKQ